MLPKGNFYALYPYGSRIYGTERPGSDWDYIGVKEDARKGEMEFYRGMINVKLMTPEDFQQLLYSHSISTLEAYFLDSEKVIVKPGKEWDFSLSLKRLRHSFSRKASHSFVKAKKKMIAPYDWASGEAVRGKKSLFHSLRILHFGIQIASEGRIVDYSAANDIFEEIMTEPSNDWQVYHDRWKPEYNRLCTEFRELAPKE